MSKITIFFKTIEEIGCNIYQELINLINEGIYDRISFIGASFGGLLARYVIGKLILNGIFNFIMPINYISLATPHLGIRCLYNGGIIKKLLFSFSTLMK